MSQSGYRPFVENERDNKPSLAHKESNETWRHFEESWLGKYAIEKVWTFIGALVPCILGAAVRKSSLLQYSCDPLISNDETRRTIAVYELVFAVLETLVCTFYVGLTWRLERDVKSSNGGLAAADDARILKRGRSNLWFYIFLPYIFYVLCAGAAHIVLMAQYGSGLRIDKDPVPSLYYLEASDMPLMISLEAFFLLDTIAQAIMVVRSLTIQLRIPAEYKAWVTTLDVCIGYMFSYNLFQLILDVLDTWSTSYIRTDNVLISGSISFRFFTLCAVFNLAFISRFERATGNVYLLNAEGLVNLASAVTTHERAVDVRLNRPISVYEDPNNAI